MLSIAICDDMVAICSDLEHMLNKYADSICEKFEIEFYYTGKKLYEDLQGGACYDLLILDIEMPGMNGVSIGKKIRQELKNNDVGIIYISSHSNYAMELFQVRPFDFLVKPLKQSDINHVMEEFIEVSGKNPQIFCYTKGRNEIKAYTKDILYFTIKGRVIEMVTVTKTETFYGRLSDISKALEDQPFFCANKSQIVNYNKVKEFYYDRLVTEDGKTITISQGRRKEIQEMLKEYSEKEMRHRNDMG